MVALVVDVAKVVEVVRGLDVVVETGELTVAVAAFESTLMSDVYAGLGVRSLENRQASPCPEKVEGTQEYLSSKSQTVIPTHFETERQAFSTLT